MSRAKINVAKIKRAAQEAQFITAQAIHAESLDVIRTPGIFEGFPDSDIVRTGRLRDRNLPPVRTSPEEVKLINDARDPRSGAPYPLFVLLGYTTSSGTVVPGRNWWLMAAMRIGVERVFAEAFRGAYR